MSTVTRHQVLFYFVVLGVVSFRVLSRVLQSMFEDDR